MGGGMGGPMMGPMGGGMGGGKGPQPKIRVPVNIMFILSVVGLAGNVMSNVGSNIGIVALSGLGGLMGLAGLVAAIFALLILIDLKNYTQDPELNNWWMVFIPCVNIWYWMTKVRPAVSRARQMSGLSPDIKSGVQYFFLGAWAIAADVEQFSVKG